MSIAVLLILAFALPAGAARAARGESFPDLPRLNLDNFLPAVRQQVRQAYATAEANPKDAEASGGLGMVLDAYEQYDAAAACYQRAHLLDPRSFRWLYYLGWVQAAQGQHEDAAATLQEAMRLRPENRPAALSLARNLLAIGQWDQAGNLYRTISKTHPESAEAHYGLGRVAAARGDAAAAAAAYLKSCELFPAYRRGALRAGAGLSNAGPGRGGSTAVRPVRAEQNGGSSTRQYVTPRGRRTQSRISGAPSPRSGSRAGRQDRRGDRRTAGSLARRSPNCAEPYQPHLALRSARSVQMRRLHTTGRPSHSIRARPTSTTTTVFFFASRANRRRRPPLFKRR